MSELSDDELLSELGVDLTPSKAARYTPEEERIIAGFEDIQAFYEKEGRLPMHGEGRDIFERLYAVRLDRLRELPGAKELLADVDQHGLLDMTAAEPEVLDDSALLEELGVADKSIFALRHVTSQEERKAAEMIANRTACENFDELRGLFDAVESDLKNGIRETRPFKNDASILLGQFFILSGQVAYVAHVGETFKAPNGDTDARLRVVFSNGTESNLLMRSLQRALYADEAGRRITDPHLGPLFDDKLEDGDVQTGTIYVLRSLSDEPYVKEHRELIHKIGVTSGKVETRIANAKHDATFLLADVEVIATYKLANVNPTKLERIFHRIFASARLDIALKDRFGADVQPKEWFLVPLPVVDEAVQRIQDGSITEVIYDPKSGKLVGCSSAKIN